MRSKLVERAGRALKFAVLLLVLIMWRDALFDNLQLGRWLPSIDAAGPFLLDERLWIGSGASQGREISVLGEDRQSEKLAYAQVLFSYLQGGLIDFSVVERSSAELELCEMREACRFVLGLSAFYGNEATEAAQYWDDRNLWPRFVSVVVARDAEPQAKESYVRYITTFQQLYPEHGESYMRLGLFARSEGEHAQAIPYFYEASTRYETLRSYDALCYAGEAYVYGQIDLEKGVMHCKEALAGDPSNIWLYERLARLQSIVGDCVGAAETSRASVVRLPHRPESQQLVEKHATDEGLSNCESA